MKFLFYNSKKEKPFLIYIFFFGFFLCLPCTLVQSVEDRIIGAYYESWSQFTPGINGRKSFTLQTIETSLITDLYIAFANFGFLTKEIAGANHGLTGNFSIQPLYANDTTKLYPELLELKKRSEGKLRLFLSIGGGQFNNPKDPMDVGNYTYTLFSRMVSTASGRREFIQSAINYAHRYGFDGIDIDWEYPGVASRGGEEKDFENFIEFLKECMESFHAAAPSLLLSFCAPSVMPQGLSEKYRSNPDLYYRWVFECSKHADRVTLMAYNYHTPLGEEKTTGVNAPLHRDTNPSSLLYIAKSLENYLNHGIELKKIVLGIPLYGWLYENVLHLAAGDATPEKPFSNTGSENSALLPYYEIADRIAQKKIQFGVDSITSTAYAYNLSKKQWISFDTPETVALKIKEAADRNLGGVIFWAINLDEYQWDPKFPNIQKASK